MIKLNINGKSHNVDVEPDTPLLWAIREQVGLTGTKYGCGIAQCGACTVHIDGAAVRSCAMPVSAAAGKRITTSTRPSPISAAAAPSSRCERRSTQQPRPQFRGGGSHDIHA